MLSALIDWSFSLGDLLVGIGTLALAGVTWQLAKNSAASLEAQDLPFLLATPDRDRALDLMTVHPGEEGSTDVQSALYVDLINLGAGPAILDGIDLRDGDTDERLVMTDWEVDMLVAHGGESDGTTVAIPLRGDAPDEGKRLRLEIFYRSASANRYVTTHFLRVGKQGRAYRLTFRRAKVRG